MDASYPLQLQQLSETCCISCKKIMPIVRFLLLILIRKLEMQK